MVLKEPGGWEEAIRSLEEMLGFGKVLLQMCLAWCLGSLSDGSWTLLLLRACLWMKPSLDEHPAP